MLDMARQGLSFLGDLITEFFLQVFGFFMQFFPDADPSMMENIRSWGDAMCGYSLTFNVFYFVDMNLVGGFFNLCVVMLGAYVVYVFAKLTINLIHSLVEMIPIVE